MARSLTKKDQNEVVYQRPPAIESAIDEALKEAPSVLARRAWVLNERSPQFLPMESLVYLVRDAWRRRDDNTVSAVMAPLLARCEAILKAQLSDDRLPNATEIRENILSDFSLLFAQDGSDHGELDYFECRFHRAFRFFRISAIRNEITRSRHLTPLPVKDDPRDASNNEETFARLSEEFRNPPTQLNSAFRDGLMRAIDSLPRDQRDAVMLCHVLGYKEESVVGPL